MSKKLQSKIMANWYQKNYYGQRQQNEEHAVAKKQ